jgi:outer membrane protein
MSSPPRPLTSLRALALLATALCSYGPASAQGEQPVAPPPAVDAAAWSLEQCVEAALRNNPAVTMARASVWSSEAAIERARSGRYPQVTLDASAAAGSSAAGVGHSTASSSLGVGLTWTFWQTGRRDAVSQSRSELESVRMDLEDTLQGLVQQVAVDYYAVLASRELVQVAEDGLRAAEEQLASVNAKIAEGKVAEVEAFSAESDRAKAELDLIDARTGEQLTMAQLRNVMGLDHVDEMSVAPGTLDSQWQPPTVDEAIALAEANRPNLLSQEAAIRAREYALERAQDQRDPAVSLTGTGGLEPFAGARNRSRWSIGAKLSWSLFDGYSLRAQETQARASLRQATASLRQAGLQATLEVEQAYIELERTEQRIRAGETSVAAAEAALAGARGRYAENKGILLEVTTARAAYTSASAALVQARFDRQVALISVRRATGTLPVPAVEPALEEQGVAGD